MKSSYDGFTYVINDHVFENYTKMTEEFKKFLSKRKEFLDLIAEYLQK
jgi:hypothetical protein